MDLANLYHSEIFSFVVLPILIFVARIIDMTLDTLRIIYIARGMKFIAPVIGFFEALIWLTMISQIFKNLTNPLLYLAYAGGFATGNFVGIMLEEKMALGTVVIRIITQKNSTDLINFLKTHNYGLTQVEAKGAMGPVNIIFTITKRKNIPFVIKHINKFNPAAFYTIEDVRTIRKGGYPPAIQTKDLHGASTNI